MVRLNTRTAVERKKELRRRNLLVLPDGLRFLRETHLRDAAFLDSKGKRIYCPGELRSVYTGLAEADYLIQHGKTKEEKFRGGLLKRQFVEMEQDLLKTMGGPLKRVSCPNPEVRAIFKERIKKEVFGQGRPKTTLEKAKERVKKNMR